MSESASYDAQHRGDDAAYAQYYAGMDTTMRQKLAFVGAHFLLDPGSRIADIGCGSGSGTYQLALLNPQIQVIGVDINPESIKFAREKFQLPNLEFRKGDALQPLFADDPLDGILSSSTLHHVYTFNDYSHDAVRQALKNHFRCLREDGIFVLRDFVSPPKDSFVLLELSDEPSRGDDISKLSDADLLQRFARTARPLDRRCGPGFFLEEIEPRHPRTRCFRLEHQWAVEFVLRKDYRRDWDVELLEAYTYFTADEFAQELAHAGGRLLCAEPYWNPWIVKNRFEGKFRITAENGWDVGWPPTNFVAVAQRAGDGASLRFSERRPSDQRPTFLDLGAMKDVESETPSIYDLVRRPHPVCDLIPWRVANGRLRIVARHGYPRPITRAVPRGPTMIDGSRWGGYLIEPITGMTSRDASSPAIATEFMERTGINRAEIVKLDSGLSYYPSPGGIDEIVRSLFIEIASHFAGRALPPAVSSFSTAGRVQEFDAQDLLRAAHVGVLPEARLELNVYALMRRLGIQPEPFIGETIEIPDTAPVDSFGMSSLEALMARPAITTFAQTEERAGYLRLIRSVFADQTDEGGEARTLVERELEFVIPREHSVNTVVALPVVLHQGRYLVGLETRLLPVPQLHEGNAQILVAPAWRLAREIVSLAQARRLIATQFHVASDDVLPLGAAYFPSPGITPERVHSFVVRVARNTQDRPYDFVPLDELHAQIENIRDGHLLVIAMRLVHALGL